MGFDNWEVVAAEARPPLTSVDMNLEEIGRPAWRAGALSLRPRGLAALGARGAALPARPTLLDSATPADSVSAAEAVDVGDPQVAHVVDRR